MARPKIENPASRHAAFSKRRAGLFKKARELAVLCDAEVGIIIISAEGKIHQYASSSMKNIITRFRTCYDSGDRRALQPKPEEPEEQVPKEVGAPKQKADKLKLRRLLGDECAQMMNLHELCALEEILNEGLFLIKETKINLLQEELDQSRMQEQQVLKKNQMLLKQVEGLQSFVPAIYCPRPISVHFHATEHDGRPGDREFLPWATFAAPLAITSNSETGSDLQEADNASRLTPPITNDYGHPTMHGADKDSLPSTSFGAPLAADNSNNKLINTLKPPLHWLPHGADGTCLS